MITSTNTSIYHKKNNISRIKTHQQRKKYWLETTGAMYEMCYNTLYYPRLLQEKSHLESNYTMQIDKDLGRTFPEDPYFKNQANFRVLKNILVAYSWRNPNVGYCQGMNFIAGRFLTLGFSELETFWLLVQVVEKYLPFEYFSTMSGVLIDQKIFDYLLRTRIPNVAKAFDRLEFNSSLITVQWFVCMYAYTFSADLVASIWDEIFTFGYSVMYKFSLAVFWSLQKEIQKKKELTEIFSCVESYCKKISDINEFLKLSDKKQFRIKPLLMDRLKELATKEVESELNERLDNVLTEREIIERIDCRCDNEDECKQKNHLTNGYFTFISKKGINLIDDYLDSDNFYDHINISLIREPEDIMVGKKNHLCKADPYEGIQDKVIHNDFRSSFMVFSDELRDLE
jgi:Rab-GTPase-TBC domain